MPTQVSTQVTRDALVTLYQSSTPLSRGDLGIPKSRLSKLAAEDVVQFAGTRVHTDEHGNRQRGRPEHVFKLTRKGRDRARRAAKRAAA